MVIPLRHVQIKVLVQEVQRIDRLQVAVVAANGKLSGVRLGGVEKRALVVVGRPDHLHFHDELPVVLVFAADIHDGVLVERVVGHDLWREILD